MIPLIIGFAIVVTLLVGVVVDASAAFLKRQQLNALADGAALAATEGLEGEQVYTEGLGERAVIDPAAAHAAVAAYLRASGQPGVKPTVIARDRSVTVRLRTTIDLPFRVGDLGGAVPVSGTGTGVIAVSE